jgi:hypothetical protein
MTARGHANRDLAMTVMPNTMPEGTPIHTYVATIPTFGNNFLTTAKNFHKSWGLDTISVSSLEAIISHLAKQTLTKSRIRIVTHANEDSLFLPFFKGGQKDQEITADLLNAFAKSDVKGLTLLFGNVVDLSVQLGGNTLLEIILADLRADAQTQTLLVPFGLKDPPSVPHGAVLELFQRSVEQVAVPKINTSSANKLAMQTALGIMLDAARIDGLRGRVGAEAGVTPGEVTGLEAAIIAVANNLLITPNNPGDANYFLNLKVAVKAIDRAVDKFRSILTEARNRFTNNSIIDIRGCRAGANMDYLKAIANFFGSNSTKPKVTGPDFFQSFPKPASKKFFNSVEAATLISSKPELEGELDHWAQVTGQASTITPAAMKLISYCDRFVLPVSRSKRGWLS